MSTSSTRLFFFISGFSLLVSFAGVALNRDTLHAFQGSVAQGDSWAKRLTLYASLGALLTEANAPGNDVFGDSDVVKHRAHLTRVDQLLSTKIDEASRDAQTLDPAIAERISADLAEFRQFAREQSVEAAKVFAAFESHDRTRAGAHMAAMDQRLALANRHLQSLRATVQDAQSATFERSLKVAESNGGWLVLLVLAVVVTVCASLWYGKHLGETFKAKQRIIDDRNRDMQQVLESIDQGLFTMDSFGTLGKEASGAWHRIAAATPNAKTLQEVLAAHRPDAAEWLSMSLEMIRQDIMPEEVTIAQLPQKFTANARTYTLRYKAIGGEPGARTWLVVVDDVTEALAMKADQEEKLEALSVLEQATRDSEGLNDFVATTSVLVKRVVAGEMTSVDRVTLARDLHTLKGNSAIYGLLSLSERCHHLENQLTDNGSLSTTACSALREHWARIVARVNMVSHAIGGNDAVVVPMASILRLVHRDDMSDSCRSELGSFLMRDTTPQLQRLARAARSTATNQGKADVQVVVDSSLDVLLPRGVYTHIWQSLVHAIRNAVDHGIESTEERKAKGKPAGGRIDIRTYATASNVHIEISDDGRGVDWAKLLARAASFGLGGISALDAFFADGVSSADNVTSISGRGIGMSALRAACQDEGGRVEVRSEAGAGTTVTCVLPRRSTQELLAAAALVHARHPRGALTTVDNVAS